MYRSKGYFSKDYGYGCFPLREVSSYRELTELRRKNRELERRVTELEIAAGSRLRSSTHWVDAKGRRHLIYAMGTKHLENALAYVREHCTDVKNLERTPTVKAFKTVLKDRAAALEREAAAKMEEADRLALLAAKK